ncbi:MAG: DciA family protein [Rhodospirillaceae bacterium]
MAENSDGRKPVRRGGPARAVGSALGRVTATAYGNRGFVQGEAVRHWREIAGDLLARHTLPDRITYPRGQRSGGLLHLQVDNSAVATEVQHLTPLIVEKINTYFGYGAVKDIHIFQRPLPKNETNRRISPRPLSPGEQAVLADELAEVTDPELRQALEALGEAVIRRREKPVRDSG